MQISLADRSMQAWLLRIGREGLFVFLRGLIPTAALEQQIAKKTVAPCRLAVQVRAAISQTRREIQILVAKLEPSFTLVRLELRKLAKLFCSAAKIFLRQIARSQSLACLAIGRIQLQRVLKESERLVRKAQLDVVHSHNDVGSQ